MTVDMARWYPCPARQDPWMPSLCEERTLLALIPPALLFLLGGLQSPALLERYAERKLAALPGRLTYGVKLTLLALAALMQAIVTVHLVVSKSHDLGGVWPSGAAFLDFVATLSAFALERISHPTLSHGSTPLLLWSLSDLAISVLTIFTAWTTHPRQSYLAGLSLLLSTAHVVHTGLIATFFGLELLGPQGWAGTGIFARGRGAIRLGGDDEYAEGAEQDQLPCPKLRANIFQRVTFSWLTPLMKAGSRKTLIEEDLWALPPDDHTHRLSRRLELAWKKSKIAAARSSPAQKKKKPSLLRALGRAYGGPFFVAAILKLVQDTLAFAQPLLLKRLLRFFASFGTRHGEPAAHGYLIGITMFACAVLQTIVLQAYFARCFETGMRIRAGLTSLVYKKALVLSPSERSSRQTGDIVNLQASDTTRLQDFCQYANVLWSGVYQIIVTLFLLYQFLGWSMLAGFAVVLVCIPLTALIAKYQGRLQKQQMTQKDRRTSLMAEIISNIRSIKFYAWETAFARRVSEVRNDQELKTLRSMGLLWSSAFFMWNLAPFSISFAAFAAFTLVTGRPLTSDIVFPALALFQMLQIPLAILPTVVGQFVECLVSIGRLSDFLLAEELQADAVVVEPILRELERGDEVISITGGEFTWAALHDSTPSTLEDITLSVKKGKLIAVVGQVGSGKSSLLSAILGEMHKLAGAVHLRGTVAYCAQTPWILNATVRENITFGHRFEPEFYELVLEACALKPDLSLLKDGDATEVGEKGISLSGGQKARIGLARAVYARPDIVLLDDVLSAVDAHVARHLFDRIIGPSGLLSDKARLLCTHALPFCKQADELVFLRKGSIFERSTFDEAIAGDTPLSKLLVEFGKASTETAPASPSDETVVESAQDEEDLQADDLDLKRKLEAVDDAVLKQPAQVIPVEEQKRNTLRALKQSTRPKENREQGAVKSDVYKGYLESMGWSSILLFAASMLLYQVFQVTTTVWLKYWSEHNQEDRQNSHLGFYLGVYGALGITAAAFFAINAAVTFALCSIRSATVLHHRLFDAVIRAPMRFFESTASGTILNRFAADIAIVDVLLPRMAANLVRCIVGALSMLGVIVICAPPLVLVVIPLLFVYRRIQVYYLATSRELKRLESVTKSPVFASFSETLNGLSTIRAFRSQARFVAENDARVDRNLECYFPSINCNRWLAVRLEFLGATLILAVSTFAVYLLVHASSSAQIAGSTVGLMLSYVLSTSEQLDWIVRSAVEVETNSVSVERILEYTKLPSEAPFSVPSRAPPPSWPAEGAITFENVEARYRPELDPALKGVSFAIKGGEKVGVCGRTGAGKSSLTMALYRIIELSSGKILIDNLVVSHLGLHDLRARLSIIPQDAQMYSGRLRDNLDPLGEYDDAALWTALGQCRLREVVEGMDGKLDAHVDEGGANFSAGQRQLLCLGRALLRRRRILILDEATAAVDHESDREIQAVIRREFADNTIVTIAHRIPTVMDCDKILVLDAGKVAEFDTPAALLQRPDSIFRSLAVEAGVAE
ncbi:hypothetical protein JCM10207_003170 [Rhodosporidiobolus poonsookiae]